MMRLYSRADCPFCWKVRIALAEHGQPVEIVPVALGEKHPDVVALSPQETVPVLVDGEVTVWDSTVMLEYLEDRDCREDGARGAALLPDSAAMRARAREIEHFSDTLIGPSLRDVIFEKRSKPRAEWDAARIGTSAAKWSARQAQLENWLGDAAFFAARFSIAECALMPRFGLAEQYGVGVSEDFPRLFRWFAAMRERPSYGATLPPPPQFA